jgi:hypothetical protein
MARSLPRQRSDTIAMISDEVATTSFAGAMLQVPRTPPGPLA